MTETHNSNARGRIMEALSRAWPDHAQFLAGIDKNLDADARACAQVNADLVEQVHANRLDELAQNYVRVCQVMKDEELYFRRHGRYRAENVEDAIRIVAELDDFWPAYLDGLLLSHVFWHNHIQATADLIRMTKKQAPKRILEIGPGHGLLTTQLALQNPAAELEAWDIEAESLRATQAFAELVNVSNRVTVRARDASGENGAVEKFDSIVLYELLEHLDDPGKAVAAISRHLAAGGRIYVNIPINSPAPDHVALFTSSEQVDEMAKKAGVLVVESHLFPQTGYTLEKALKVEATVSYVGCWRLDV